MPSSKKVANRQLTHSASLRCAPFLRRLFAFTSKLAGSRAKQRRTQELMQAQSGQSLHASASLRYVVAFRFVSCLFPHEGQSWVKGMQPFIRKNWNYSKHWSWRLYGLSFCSTLQLSRSFKMLSWFYSGGFSGTSFVWENCFSSRHR